MIQDRQERTIELEDRIAVQDVICAVTLHSDMDEPSEALACFTADAVIDYSSVSGPESRDVPVAEHRRRLATFLPGFDMRQHQVTNFQIHTSGDDATSRAQVRAIHVIGGRSWVAYATYHHRLVRTAEGWKIRYQRADLTYQEGQELVEEARARVAAEQPSA